jgi:hypothetical protein
MALKNEFNRGGDGRDGGGPDPVVRLDAALTVVADRWAERWQARGGGSRQALTQGLYALAAGAAGVYVLLTGEWLFLGLGALAYAGGARGKQRGALIDEIQLEAVGLPRHTLKYLSVFLLGLGLFGLLSGLAAAVVDALLLGTPAPALPGLVGGLAITALKVADYIARTNPSRHDGDPEQPLPWAWPRRALPVASVPLPARPPA